MYKFYQSLWLVMLSILALSAYGKSDYLSPDQAFAFSAQLIDQAQTLQIRYDIAPGYYLYRERFQFRVDGPVTLGEAIYPKGQTKFDENFQRKVEYYRDQVLIRIPIKPAPKTTEFTLYASSQGCADGGLCYPPQQAQLQLSLNTGQNTEQYRFNSALHSGNLLWVAGVFLGLGVLLSFTPCVLPMVPILASVIVGTSKSRMRSVALALTYTLGMAVVYTTLGIAAGLVGEGLAPWLQTPWILATAALLLVIFALAMFGIYDLQLPRNLQNWLAGHSGKIRGGRYLGVFAIGAFSALIIGPCVAAPLAGALLYVGQTHNVLVGAVALFFMALGMGVPLILVGLSAGALLPRAGAWMQTIKRFFGVLLLVVALWIISPLLPIVAQMFATATLLVVLAVFLRVFDSLSADSEPRVRLGKALGIVLLIAAIVLILGAATGGRSLTQPLAHWLAIAQSTKSSPQALRFERVRTLTELEQALRTTDRMTMLDFYADWCVSCKELEHLTYGDERVIERLKNYRLLQVDVTENSSDDRALLKRFNLFGPPAVLFFDRQGQLIKDTQVIGFENAERFLQRLQTLETKNN